MERNYMNPNSIVDFEFLEETQIPLHEHENPEILFVLEGKLNVTVGQMKYQLSGEDFLLVNASIKHRYHTDHKILAVRFQISFARIKEMLHREAVLFHCTSLQEEKDAADEMRKILKDILFCNISGGLKNDFYISSLHYQLLSLLCSRFLLSSRTPDEEISEDKLRMGQIMKYIREHYREPIKLQDVADELFLSTTYLSKYIKKSSGNGFVGLINSVRLPHAMEDLIYTDKPMINIAMDNGFASVAALNKVFRETYQATPSAYRKEKQGIRQGSLVNEQVSRYLHQHMSMDDASEKSKTEAELVLKKGKEESSPLRLKQIMNAGKASDLLRASVQRQVLFCRDQLGIRHIRFWNIFEDDMLMAPSSGDLGMNYEKLYEILDFLVNNQLCPYIELRNKHKKILRTANRPVRSFAQSEMAEDKERRAGLLEDLFGHLIRRYGRSEVSSWIFHYSVDSRPDTGEHAFDFRYLDDARWDLYLQEFELTASAFRFRFPDGCLGGAGFPVQHLGEEKLTALFDRWRSCRFLPDFIAFTSFPYQLVEEDGVQYAQRRTDPDFVKNDVAAIKKALRRSTLGELPLHLTECNLTLSDRAYVNDSMMRGAFTAATLAQIVDKIEYFGLWNAMDLYSDLQDSSRYLFGGSGFLTKTGIPKPPAHVLTFLDRLYSENLTAQDDFLISSNSHRHYKLLIHHLVGMNTAYYLKEEDELDAYSIEQMTESSSSRILHIRIEDVPDGSWQIRRYCLSRDTGSILNEWLNLNIHMDLRQDETRYLERICVPRLFVQRENASNSVLEFNVELAPNEVQYLHITEFN